MRFNNYLNESFVDKLFKVFDKLDIKDSLSVGNIRKIADAMAGAFNAKIQFTKRDLEGSVGVTRGNEISIAIPSGKVDPRVLLGIMFHELAHVCQNNTHIHFHYLFPSADSLWEFVQYFLQPQERSPKALSVALSFIINKIDPETTIKTVDTALIGAKDFHDAYDRMRSLVPVHGWDVKELGDIFNFVLVYTAIRALSFQERGGVPKENKTELKNQWYVFHKNFINSYKKLKFYFDKYGL